MKPCGGERKRRVRTERRRKAREEFMCPACLVGAATAIASVMATGGLAAVVTKKLGAKNGTKKSVQDQNPKEETWEK